MKRRSESFFGLHFDFHANPENCPDPIGATLKESDIREICETIRPDFLQIDCKGHPGWTSYPSKLGNAMPRFAEDSDCKGDPLALWRRVTKEEDVALYMHYSGVYEMRYCAENPDQAIMTADGTRSKDIVRVTGKYPDELLIPQLSELAEKYGVNGAWVDGECWADAVDFGPDVIEAFERETGIKLGGKLPAKPEDEHYEDYREYCRELFRRYVARYVDIIHSRFPDFQIASNWAYTDHMPEKVSSNVDFISGDLNPWNSFSSARHAGRAIAQQNRTWDLMSWNFRTDSAGFKDYIPKHPVQIMQEAAAVIALGGGFQNYIMQKRDGSPRMDEIRRMKQVAEFCRARQPYCHKGRAAHQVALLLSTYDRHRESMYLYSRNGYEKVVGACALLCDSAQSAEIVCEHTLAGHCGDYPVIYVPELFAGLAPETVAELVAYAKNGGSLVLAGVKTCELFAKSTEFAVDGERFAITPFGKGKIAAMSRDIGLQYYNRAEYLHRELIKSLMSELYTPVVRVESAEGLVEIVALRKDGRLFVQLVNANGNHTNMAVATEDYIPPVTGVKLSIALPGAPNALVLQPEGRELPFEYIDGRAYTDVGTVPMHEIVEVR